MKKEHVWCKNSGVENTIDTNIKMHVIRREREREKKSKRKYAYINLSGCTLINR